MSANTQALLTLANPDLMLAELKVDEADIANVEAGQVVRVFTAAEPKEARLAKVTRTGVSAKQRNTGSLYFDVKALLDSLKAYIRE
nr:HlyD family efflux transporter periplasmic adaptor subunit [Veronia nyctiphanis]